jgi:hypothetical protein
MASTSIKLLFGKHLVIVTSIALLWTLLFPFDRGDLGGLIPDFSGFG